MSIDPRIDIGHVHLKVADLERALGFYCGVLGFEEQARYGRPGRVRLGGGYHHHIGLNTWESRAARRRLRAHRALPRRDSLSRPRDAGRCAAASRRCGDPARRRVGPRRREAIYLRDPDRKAKSRCTDPHSARVVNWEGHAKISTAALGKPPTRQSTSYSCSLLSPAFMQCLHSRLVASELAAGLLIGGDPAALVPLPRPRMP